MVWPEYTLEGKRVDFALCYPPGKPIQFVEVKQAGQVEDADRQLFEYAFHSGVPMAVLTNGQEWHFFLPGEQGNYQERCVYKLDILERDIGESTGRLTRYLQYDRVRSGEALASARDDYKDVARTREVWRTLPKAWRKLVEEQDTLLIDLVAETVESLCGYKPDTDTVGRFLVAQLKADVPGPVAPIPGPKAEEPKGHRDARIHFVLKGRKHETGSALGVLIAVLNELSADDSGFLDRFAARPRHGRSRRYVGRTREELYPGRPDLGRNFSRQLSSSGWWVGTNYSKAEIQKILMMACEVAGLQYGTDLSVSLE